MPTMPGFGAPEPPQPSPGSNEKRVAAVMAQQLEAVLIFVEGRREEAIVLARQAAAVEDELTFEFGPPVPVKPGHEFVGRPVDGGARARAKPFRNSKPR